MLFRRTMSYGNINQDVLMVTATLVYPEHIEITPSDFLVFVEADGFLDDWMSFNLTDEDLHMTQICITGLPEIGCVLQDTNGLREIQLASESTQDRCLILRYVYFPDFSKVFFLSVHEGCVPVSTSDAIEISELIARDYAALESRDGV